MWNSSGFKITFSWIRSVKVKGEEILPKLLADDEFLKSIQEFSMFDPDLLRMIGFFAE